MEPNNSCPECGGEDTFNFDPFGLGDNTLDQHMDCLAEQEEINKRVANAAEMDRKLGGNNSGGIEGELKELTKPKLRWQDFVRFCKGRKKEVQSKNDWSNPRRKPLFAGLFIPRKLGHKVKFLLAIDTSGSMPSESIAYAVSQVQALNERGEGVVVSWDQKTYWKKAVKIKNARREELQKTNIVGGGGTCIKDLFDTYKENVGDVDIMIIITDGGLADIQVLNNVVIPKTTQVVWLVVNDTGFKPPFGRVFRLMNELMNE